MVHSFDQGGLSSIIFVLMASNVRSVVLKFSRQLSDPQKRVFSEKKIRKNSLDDNDSNEGSFAHLSSKFTKKLILRVVIMMNISGDFCTNLQSSRYYVCDALSKLLASKMTKNNKISLFYSAESAAIKV